jgi:transposase
MDYCYGMPIRAPKSLSDCKRFFLEPSSPKQRQYEALRAYFAEELPSAQAARAFGYTPGSFQVMCHQFRREPTPAFFLTPQPGPRSQPKKSAAREAIVEMRKRNHSVYEISEILKSRNLGLSPTAVREVLKAEGFAALPRRLDEERPERARPSIEAAADVRQLSLLPRRFETACGGLFLFVPGLVALGLDGLAKSAALPGSKMIPASHALRAMLALKLWSIEHRSHVMPHVADEGLSLLAGLNVIPKRSFLCEYSCRVGHQQIVDLQAAYHKRIDGDGLLQGESFNLDFHSIPYYGEHPLVQCHFVAMRSRRQKSVLTFLAQDLDGRAFCYSNADLRKGEESEEIFKFIAFWKRAHRQLPRHLVFDSKLTTLANLARLDKMGITFMTLRARSPSLKKEVALLPASAFRQIELDVPTRKFRFPKVYERTVQIEEHNFREMFIKDLGHEEPTILLTNDRKSAKNLITRYAKRMLIENALSDAVRFFHMNALSSAVGIKVDFDMALLVIASGLYRQLAKKMRGYADAQAGHIFRDLINMPATVTVGTSEVTVRFHRRAHLPIIIDSGMLDSPLKVPWWNGATLRMLA